MVPYISPEEYEVYHEKYVKSGERTWSTTDAWKQRYTFSGKYGANLMEEVARYAVVAAQVPNNSLSAPLKSIPNTLLNKSGVP